MITIQDALSTPGDLLAVWDYASEPQEWMGIYSVGSTGARLLAWERMDRDQRDTMTEQIRSRVRVGATCGPASFVWVADAAGFALWSLERAECSSSEGVLALPDGAVPVEVVRAVISFVDEDDLGHRGVQVKLTDGSRRVVVEEHDPTAKLDPTYNRDNLLVDGSWTTYLGRDLAAWLGVPYRA